MCGAFLLKRSKCWRLSKFSKLFNLWGPSKHSKLSKMVVAFCRDLMVRVATMYSPVKVVPYIQEGLHSKNNRSVGSG